MSDTPPGFVSIKPFLIATRKIAELYLDLTVNQIIMKRIYWLVFVIYLLNLLPRNGRAQTLKTAGEIFPGTVMYENIPYANDTLKKHQLDIYLPAVKKLSYPLVVWIHGGAWMSNDKHADMSYMVNTLRNLINEGYAVASIDYRWSTMAPFPAQVQDCYAALQFLNDNAAQYGIDDSRIALMGFSAGGHLANLVGLANNDFVRDFYYQGKKPTFKINVVFDFYGPSDFFTLKGHDSTDPKSPINLLLGGTVAGNPKLAKIASPVTYIDRGDPPFLIIQGEKDESVNPDQSKELSDKLTRWRIPNKLIIVPGAPHYGVMFDSPDNWTAIKNYLDLYMQ
jgi:acetyl esterase/lipase